MERSYLPAMESYFERPRINELIKKGLGYPLILVMAGPGYGKTLSLASYLKKADVRLLWLQLTARRDQPSDFWEDLVQAAQKELPDYAKKLEQLGFPGLPQSFELFRRLTAAVAENGKPLVFVADNYEKLTNERIIRFWDSLIECGLANFTLVVLCNARLPFAEVLPSNGQYRITDAELAFDEAEVQALFEHHGTTAAPGMAEKALMLTDGWPLGVHLICAGGPKSPEDFLSHISIQMATDLYEQHYFRNYPQAIQNQLILFSLLPRFSLDMLKNEQVGLRAELYLLLTQHPFIRFDNHTGLFMFQSMYHDFLQQKQSIIDQACRKQAMDAAGWWFLEQRMTDEAMDCFWAADNYDGLLEAMLRLPKIRHRASQTNAYLYRLEQIPHSYSDMHPEVDFCIAYMYLNAADVERAKELLLGVAARLEKAPDSENNRLMRGDIYATLADIATFQNKDTGLAWMKKAYALLPHGTRAHEPALLSVGNNSAFFLPDTSPGQLERMVEYFVEYAKYADKVKNGSGYGHEYLFSGEAAYFREDMDTAAALFNSAMIKAQQTEQHDIICNALWGLLRIEIYYANLKNALAILNEIETYINNRQIEALYELRDCAIAYLHLRLQDLDKVPAWLGKTMAGPDEQPVGVGRNRMIAAHYLYLAGERSRAYGMVIQTEGLLQHSGHWHEKFCLIILAAAYHLDTGAADAFERLFYKAYDMVYANNMRLALSAYGKVMMRMIDQIKKMDTEHYNMAWLEEVYKDALSYAKRLQMMRAAHSGKEHQPSSALALTKRENETLHYLAQGLTQQEMAKLMGISSNAVKKHVSKIYYKLGAINRADAIHIATVNGLVDVLSS